MASAPAIDQPTAELRLQILSLYGGDVTRAQKGLAFVLGNDNAPPAGRKKAEEGNGAGAAASSSGADSPAGSPSSAPDAEPKAEKLPEERAAETAVAYTDVQRAVTKLAAGKGRDAVIAVFDQFGVDHGSKLTEEQWPEAVQALTDALEG